jgi:hypothetical protein
MSNPRDIENMRTTFLYAAIADAQGTIRATDSKIGVLLVILIIPLTKFGAIYGKCSALLGGENKCLAEFVAVLTFMFVCLWFLSFLAAMRAIIAIDDPSRHIDGTKPTGIFYSGGLFDPKFLDALLNRPILAKKQLQQQLAELPTSAEDINKELLFEHAKLVYIRAMKINRMKYAFGFGIAWVFSGGALWLMSLLFHKF